ncbi:hypothetical protein WA016_06018 [Myxococcus stipitatus]
MLRRQKPGMDEPHTRPQAIRTPKGMALLAKKYGHLSVPVPPEQGLLLLESTGYA